MLRELSLTVPAEQTFDLFRALRRAETGTARGSCLILSRQSGLLIFAVPHAGPCVQAQPAAGMVSPFSKRARTSNTSSRLLFAMSPQTAPFFTAVRRRSPSA